MVIIKTEQEIEMMKRAGKFLAKIHREIAKMIRPGISTYEIDQFVEEHMRKNGATPEQKAIMAIPMQHVLLSMMKYAMVFPERLH